MASGDWHHHIEYSSRRGIMNETRLFPEYGPKYSALLFKDSAGINYEYVREKHNET